MPIRPKKELFCSYMAFTGITRVRKKEKEKKEVSAHDQETAALSNLQKLA